MRLILLLRSRTVMSSEVSEFLNVGMEALPNGLRPADVECRCWSPQMVREGRDGKGMDHLVGM